SQVDRISIQLEHAKEVLVKDVNMLDGLYEQNKDYFDAINIYIAAAELKKEELEKEELPRLRERGDRSANQMAVQACNNMIQNINQTLAEKIQSSILTSIPLWKNQMAIALTLLRQESASKAQQEVSNTTNDLLTKNSEMLKQNSLRTAAENERGIVDIETLK